MTTARLITVKIITILVALLVAAFAAGCATIPTTPAQTAPVDTGQPPSYDPAQDPLIAAIPTFGTPYEVEPGITVTVTAEVRTYTVPDAFVGAGQRYPIAVVTVLYRNDTTRPLAGHSGFLVQASTADGTVGQHELFWGGEKELGTVAPGHDGTLVTGFSFQNGPAWKPATTALYVAAANPTYLGDPAGTGLGQQTAFQGVPTDHTQQ